MRLDDTGVPVCDVDQQTSCSTAQARTTWFVGNGGQGAIVVERQHHMRGRKVSQRGEVTLRKEISHRLPARTSAIVWNASDLVWRRLFVRRHSVHSGTNAPAGVYLVLSAARSRSGRVSGLADHPEPRGREMRVERKGHANAALGHQHKADGIHRRQLM